MRYKYDLDDPKGMRRFKKFALTEGVAYAIDIIGQEMPDGSHLRLAACELLKDFYDEYHDDMSKFTNHYWESLNIFEELFIKAFKSFHTGWHEDGAAPQEFDQ